jgi:uncharacterized membrane protein YjgN (DUF898 family)
MVVVAGWQGGGEGWALVTLAHNTDRSSRKLPTSLLCFRFTASLTSLRGARFAFCRSSTTRSTNWYRCRLVLSERFCESRPELRCVHPPIAPPPHSCSTTSLSCACIRQSQPIPHTCRRLGARIRRCWHQSQNFGCLVAVIRVAVVASYFDRLQAPTRGAPIEGSSFGAHLEIYL